MTREVVYWDDYQSLVSRLAEQISTHPYAQVTSIFGIPRGGLVVAVSLSHLLNLPLTDQIDAHTLIVDDIVDTGDTVSQIPRPRWAAYLYVREGLRLDRWPSWYGTTVSPGVWLLFPWETVRSTYTGNRWRPPYGGERRVERS